MTDKSLKFIMVFRISDHHHQAFTNPRVTSQPCFFFNFYIHPTVTQWAPPTHLKSFSFTATLHKPGELWRCSVKYNQWMKHKDYFCFDSWHFLFMASANTKKLLLCVISCPLKLSLTAGRFWKSWNSFVSLPLLSDEKTLYPPPKTNRV